MRIKDKIASEFLYLGTGIHFLNVKVKKKESTFERNILRLLHLTGQHLIFFSPLMQGKSGIPARDHHDQLRT